MTSVLNVDTIANKAGTGTVAFTKQYAAKVWVNYNGSGTIATRTSENVSSLTDNGTGDHTVSLTNAFSDECAANMSGGRNHFYITQLEIHLILGCNQKPQEQIQIQTQL